MSEEPLKCVEDGDANFPCEGEVMLAPDPYELNLNGDDAEVPMCTGHRNMLDREL